MLVLLMQAGVWAADGTPLGRAEASALLTRLAEEWEQASKKLGNFAGEVNIEQYMHMHFVEIENASLKTRDDPLMESPAWMALGLMMIID